MWDERYSVDEYVYGTQPNDFLKENVSKLKKGSVLSLGEGEGRNALFLARQGLEVTALDFSRVGLAKAQQLTCSNGFWTSTVHADLTNYTFEANRWDNIISIFCHLPEIVRQELHKGIISGLKPGGLFLLEAYSPKQLEFKTGGPPAVELMLTLKELQDDFSGMKILHGIETIRPVKEGKYHNGQSAVVQFIAQKI